MGCAKTGHRPDDPQAVVCWTLVADGHRETEPITHYMPLDGSITTTTEAVVPQNPEMDQAKVPSKINDII